ncbi:MAG: 6-hydroxymethylpterin diphosphokinase MptE-like protein [Candidatus Nitrosopolaris sp.]
MRFIDWFQYYQNIRQQFGYSTEKDQHAANTLSKMIKKKSLDIKVLQRKIARRHVMVIGAGDSLIQNIKFIKKNRKFVKIVADGATQALIENHIKPDVVVTDLDGDTSFLRKAERVGAIIVVHSHGDNIEELKKIVPTLRRVIGTTQVMPVENVYNFGGFTDGDRCVFLADEFGAEEIVLVGMEFGDRIGKHSKKVVKNIQLKRDKMKVGKRLLEMLAKRSRSRLFDTSRKPIRGFTSPSV